MELLLGLDVSEAKDLDQLAALGIPVEEIDNAMLLTAALFRKAAGGDVAAWREIRDLIGERGLETEDTGGGVVELQAVLGPLEPPEGGGDGA